MSLHDVVITGIGLVSSLGEGPDAHWAKLSEPNPTPVLETERFAPYTVHPLPEIDWNLQIAKRGDQRQMETWQRLGTYTAGLALDDAGIKGDEALCASMDMVVAAGGGERDVSVDNSILAASTGRTDFDVLLNEKLTTDLRPTLFLAQLSNLLAGNISIVHKVTGSSRTFMGEEAAGISAVETAFWRIKSGESSHALVGGAFAAERQDMILLTESIGAHTRGEWAPLWSRKDLEGGGMITGSAGAFLVLESRKHAEERGAHVYAVIDAVEGDRGSREDGKLEARLERLLEPAKALSAASTAIFSGSTGMHALAAREKAVLESRLPAVAIRGYGGVSGHAIEVQFILGLALAGLAVDSKAKVPPFDPAHEDPMKAGAAAAVVTTIGHQRGEGVAVLSADA